MRSLVKLPAAAAAVTGNFAGNLMLRRHLVWNFVVRDLKGRYVGSLMGFFWSIVHPLVLLVSYTFVFSVIFQVKLPDPLPQNFPLFLFCGILPWLFFQDTLQRSCTSVVDNANLLRKTVFPSEILPVVLVLSNLVTHLIGFGILVIALFLFTGLKATTLLVPVYLILLSILTVGLGWLVAALQVFLRDVAQVVSVMLVLWFWFTPIFYSVDSVPEPYGPLIRLNPLTYVVEGYRDILLLGRLPDWRSVLILAMFSLVAFVVGGLVFRNTKREFIDVL
jgi:ABC-type polysaccharide/polyol phosphate export permease